MSNTTIAVICGTIAGMLYLAGAFTLGVIDGNRLVCLLVLASAGTTYLSYLSQFSGAQTTGFVLMLLSILTALIAGAYLVMGG